jgi:hypothetical protein
MPQWHPALPGIVPVLAPVNGRNGNFGLPLLRVH